MKESLKQLQAAFMLLTRLPFNLMSLDEQHFARAPRYFLLVGLVVGGLCAATYWLANSYFSSLTACILALIAGLLITGAIHEDGFADCCDGFGGGHKAESIQTIMKDSRLGSYGVLGLMALFAFKISMLNEIRPEQQLLALLVMHALARVAPLLVMQLLPYATSATTKMTSSIATKPEDLLINYLLATLLLLVSLPLPAVLGILAVTTFGALVCSHYFKKRLQGYNGDCLGATEQCGECLILLFLALYY